MNSVVRCLVALSVAVILHAPEATKAASTDNARQEVSGSEVVKPAAPAEPALANNQPDRLSPAVPNADVKQVTTPTHEGLLSNQLWIGSGFAVILILFLIYLFLYWPKIVKSRELQGSRLLLLRFLMAFCIGCAACFVTGGALFHVDKTSPGLSYGISASAGCAMFLIVFLYSKVSPDPLTTRRHGTTPAETAKEREDSIMAEQTSHVRRENLAAFERMHAELAHKHPGEWVAIGYGKLIAHDESKKALEDKIASRKDRDLILVKKVTMKIIGTVDLGGPIMVRPLGAGGKTR